MPIPYQHYIVCIRCGKWKIKTLGCEIDLATEDICDDCLHPDEEDRFYYQDKHGVW